MEEEELRIVSQIDGEEYYQDMDGEMNARKATRFILEGEKDSVPSHVLMDISDSLFTTDSVWRDKYFNSLNIVLEDLDSLNKVYLASNTFAYFLHYPEEFLSRLDNKAFDNSEIWNNLMAHEYRNQTSPEDISINSVINMAHKYCESCSNETMEFVVQYINYLDSNTDSLWYNKEYIPASIL